MLRFQRLVAFCICVEVASGWTHPMVLQPKVADSRHKGHKWQRYTSRDPKGGERHPPSLLNAEPQKRSCETTSGFSELRRGRPESSLSSLSIPSGIRQATIIRRSAPLTSDLSPTPAKNEGGIFDAETFAFPTDASPPSFLETKVRGMVFALRPHRVLIISSPSPPQNFSRILVLIAASLYGTNFASVKILDSHVPIAAGASLRFGLAALACAPFLFSRGSDEAKGSAGWAPILAGLEIGAWNSAGYLAQAVGLETTDASKSAFICR